MELVQTESVYPEPAIKRSPRLGLGVILAVCVPFWVAVAWWVAA